MSDSIPAIFCSSCSILSESARVTSMEIISLPSASFMRAGLSMATILPPSIMPTLSQRLSASSM